jgi:hypothetical protein
MSSTDLMGGYAAYTTPHVAVRELATAPNIAAEVASLPLTYILTHLTEILL